MKKHKKDKRKRKKIKSRPIANNHAPQVNEPVVAHVIIYRSELDYISRCILDYKNIETGGQLFGFITPAGTPVVLYAIGPGKDANHQTAFFNQDVNYLEKVGQQLADIYGLQHIGEWHSHHQLGLAHPSGHDAHNISHNVEKLGLSQFLLCIGVCDNTSSTLNAFSFVKGNANYHESKWIIKDIDSPFRTVIDKDLKDILLHPQTTVGNMRNLKVAGGKPAYQQSYWLNQQGNSLILKSMMDYINNAWMVQSKVFLDNDKQVHLVTRHRGNEVGIHFPMGFPQDPPLITSNGQPMGCGAEWHYEGDILNAFKTYVNNLNIRQS